MAIDPVCGMAVDEKTSKITVKHKGATYYFCSPTCKKEFEKNPQSHV